MQIDSAKLASGLRLIAEAFEEKDVEAKQPAAELLSRYEKPAAKVAAKTAAPVELKPALETAAGTNVTPIGTADMYGTPPPAVPEQVAPVVDKAEIGGLLQALWQRDGDTAGPDILARYGVTQLSLLPLDCYGEFASELKRMLGEQ